MGMHKYCQVIKLKSNNDYDHDDVQSATENELLSEIFFWRWAYVQLKITM